MTPKLRNYLNQIEEMLGDPKEGIHLWVLLTALRGPDAPGYPENVRLKAVTTAPLRSAIFPGIWRRLVETGTTPPADFRDPESLDLSGASVFKDNPIHFWAHLREAVAVLGGEEKVRSLGTSVAPPRGD